MSVPHAASDAPKTVTVKTLLRAAGLDPQDFDIEEDPPFALMQQLGFSGSLLTVRQRATGQERLYATQSGVKWLSAFSTDLRQGCFGPCRVHVSAGD